MNHGALAKCTPGLVLGSANSAEAVACVPVPGKSLKFVVQQETYPQFIGVTRNLKIEELIATTLKFSVAPIHDPKGGDFTPHLEFQRLQ